MTRKTTGMLNPYNGLPVERVGASGSREGPVSEAQAATARWLLHEMWPFKELHHGLARGWDEWIHAYVRAMWGPYKSGGAQIHGWPPLDEKYIAPASIIADCDVLHTAKEYKARDREVAYHSQVLVSGPKEFGERLRGGTWYTMRQALAMLRPIYFIRNDGQLILDWKSEMNERVRNMDKEDAALYLSGMHPNDVPGTTPGDDLDLAFGGGGPEPTPYGDLDDAFG